jgi:signal transduction histidine kinase
MAAINHVPGTSPPDRSRDVLDLVHGWLARPDENGGSLVDLLRNLATAFAASAAGVAGLTDGFLVREADRAEQARSAALPWVERPELLVEVRQAPSAVAVQSSQGRPFLCAAAQRRDSSGWLLWLEGTAGREWTPAEAAALVLAGQTAVRWLETGANNVPTWARQLDHAARQRRLEDIAVWTRRLAHDYGNVLTSILGFTELSLAQTPDNSSVRRYLGEVHRGAQQGAQLTDRYRLFARRPPPSGQPTLLDSVLVEQQKRLTGWGPDVELKVEVPGDLPPVGVSAEALHDVLGALLDNAREAIERKGRVTVQGRLVGLSSANCLGLWGSARPGPHVRLDITDTGCGLAPDVPSRLFREPFFTNKPRHRGLGLATVYGVLTSNRGGFRLLPHPEGGLTARVYLPVAAGVVLPPVAPEAEGDEDQIGADGKRPVVEENHGVLEMVRGALPQVG